eukprot:CAMPEP_0119194850 /NCGR_PEP_ID=MMETSP1316-20130426/4481_1 /TAXON_ID=41880 /ORGANISM="Pycnococcus provasolii, Strain RCC2336" /LENGTH=43 /DNA_ID= /DNA_START= /DNA_END= /DNA_ORIENTATION=
MYVVLKMKREREKHAVVGVGAYQQEEPPGDVIFHPQGSQQEEP